MDHIEWDLLSPLTPEAFAIKLCADIGLTGEAAPLIAHAMHEEILKHKKDAIEWGVIGGDVSSNARGDSIDDDKDRRDKSGVGLVKDKTGLGHMLGKQYHLIVHQRKVTQHGTHCPYRACTLCRATGHGTRRECRWPNRCRWPA